MDASAGQSSSAAPVTESPTMSPTISAQTRLLVVAPHPDDETIATGLLIQQVQAAGGEVEILLLTAGDNNPWPQRWLERRIRIRGTDRQRWGRRRHAEILQALQRLEVPSSALQALGWPDMGITDSLLQPDRTAVSTVAAAIGEFRPNLIAMPSLDDRHPDHGAAHVLVRLALTGQTDPPPLLAYLVHGHAPDRGSFEVCGSSGQREKKLMALTAHHSQMALSGNRMRRLAARPERYAGVPAVTGITSAALPWQPSAWLKPWLRLTVASPAGTQSWRWSEAPLQRDNHGVYHLPLRGAVDGVPRFAKLAWGLPSLWIFDHWGWCEI
jgi:N-acetyl-1-D-myo-inositol-2-amino-2-deoxy-alpha-D-glucopyranoside deacetylase